MPVVAVDPHVRACSSLLPRNQRLALAVQTSNRLTYEYFGEPSSPIRILVEALSAVVILGFCWLEYSSPVLVVEEPGQMGRLLQFSTSYPATLSSNSAE